METSSPTAQRRIGQIGIGATATGTVVEMKCAVVKPGGEFEMPSGLKRIHANPQSG